jgi:hypothetical protein
MISKEEIEKCINSLLGKKYLALDINIKVYKSKYELWKDIILGRASNCGKISGNFNSFTDEIKIYIFNIKIKNISILRLQILYNILHEIRHNYQKYYCSKKFNLDCNNYINIGSNYDKQWIEIDANRTARIIMNKRKDIINKILDIEDNSWFIA